MNTHFLSKVYVMRKIVCALFALLVLVAPRAASADEYRVLGSLYPPFLYNKGLHVDGVSVDMLDEIMKMTGTDFHRDNIKLVEWEVALGAAMTLKKCIIMNVPRGPDVEDKFKWVGPIYFPKYVLVGQKENKTTITSTGDLSRHTVSVIRGSGPHASLVSAGVPDESIKANTSYVQPLLHLKGGRVDFLAHTEAGTAYYLQKMRINKSRFEVEHVYKKVPLYFAFSKDTPNETIKMFNDALASYKIAMHNGDSAFEKRMRKHLPRGMLQ